MQERLKVKVQDAPCFGRDGLVGKVTPLLSASACGRSILKTQDHLLAWEYRPAYLPDPLSMQIGEAGIEEPMWVHLSLCYEPSANYGSPSIPSAFVKSLA